MSGCIPRVYLTTRTNLREDCYFNDVNTLYDEPSRVVNIPGSETSMTLVRIALSSVLGTSLLKSYDFCIESGDNRRDERASR